MSEVKLFSPEYCEAGGVGWAEMQEDAEGAWRKASDYDALAAECERLQRLAAKWQERAEIRGNTRDQLREELAALKGGRGAVAIVRTVPGTDWKSLDFVDGFSLQDQAELTKLYTAPPAQASAWVLGDTERLAFILEKHRKVVVERLPSGGNAELLEVYVEEGFMGDVRYPAVAFAGDWSADHEVQFATKQSAIDLAIAAPTPGASDGKGGE